MLARLIAGLFFVLLESSIGLAADVIPPVPPPEKGTGPPPATAPENPSQSSAPAIPPSKLDPGIERRPSAIPDSRSAVPPPNVDPNMSVNPETAPPAKDALKPHKGEEPSERPSR